MSGRNEPPRASVPQELPRGYEAMIKLDGQAHQAMADAGFDRKLVELLKIRASQLNGCAFCLDMHHRDARKLGEDQLRLDVLSAWREAASLFTAEEQLALELVEAITLLPRAGIPDELYDRAAEAMSRQQLAAIDLLSVAINGWNRIAVFSQTQPTGGG